MATLPIFNAAIRASLHCLGPHEKQIKRYPESPTTVEEHLRKRRLDLGLTQEAVASSFGISLTAYNGWECDRIPSGFQKLPAIIAFLGYDPFPPPLNGFSDEIRALRRRLGMDKREFARLVGADPKSVFNWETGRAIPLSRWRKKLLDLMACDH